MTGYAILTHRVESKAGNDTTTLVPNSFTPDCQTCVNGRDKKGLSDSDQMHLKSYDARLEPKLVDSEPDVIRTDTIKCTQTEGAVHIENDIVTNACRETDDAEV